MATKGCDSTAHHHSSIALLQERFRQLQRAKEMRKEKELLRLFSEPDSRSLNNPSSKRNYEPTGLFFHSHETLIPHHASRQVLAPQYQSSLYIQPGNLQGKQAGFQGSETPSNMFGNVGSTGSAMSYNMAYHHHHYHHDLDDHNSDVDTSLHL